MPQVVNGISLDNTCKHGFTEKYRLYKENLLKRKLKMIDNNDDHDDNHHDKDNHQKNHHRQQNKKQPPPVRGDDQKIKIERFMTDMHRYLITIKREEFPIYC